MSSLAVDSPSATVETTRFELRRRGLGCIALVGLFALPLGAAALFGRRPLADYFRFPPDIVRSHPGFSWLGVGLVLMIGLPYAIFLVAPIWGPAQTPMRAAARRRFPAWGWWGVVLVATSWLIAWMPVDSLLRRHSFPPLWLGYVLIVDAWVFVRAGTSMLARDRAGFLWLFPVSAVLWWLFEYVNRFVENWFYVSSRSYTPLEYALHATPAFATVLPALLETSELLATLPVFGRFASGPRPLTLAGIERLVLGLGGIGLLGFFGMGAWPQLLFPFAWLGPLMILLPIVHRLLPEASSLPDLARGDFRGLIVLSAAGPVCGFFWELWNVFSLPKWQYQLPYVHAWKVFEMPLLGYLGYVPFGWECLVLGRRREPFDLGGRLADSAHEK